MPSKTKSTNSARYVIQLPVMDKHHNQIRDLSQECWQFLEGKIARLIHSMHTEGPHQGHKGAHRHLHILALDTPETDSTIKQLAVFVGQLVNHRTVLVSKEGSQGADVWHVANKWYNHGPADINVIDTMPVASGSVADQVSLGPRSLPA
jgi:hypothetical protein